ncbi:leucine-rich repeat flightless-interacting protein 1 isoform X8 [Nothobranchius furzeri]|uniref:leucine-rich repeat flightless-interacting protein 1 isoform X8 n=1 Tax=Nothobranchius furzeri TaxID=105023 RepID=UPI00077D2B0E
MGTQGTGRRRSTKKERSTAEDDALNLIAREAEARLAAKRAARAEAREIRMKELERQQKEIFQVQKKYYGLNTKLDERVDHQWGDIEQWMEDSEKYSRSSRILTLSDDDERMSVGSRGSVRSDLDSVGAYGGGGSSLHKKSKRKKKHKHKEKDRDGCDEDYSVLSSRSSRLSDESRKSRSSRLDLQPASFSSSDPFGLKGLSSSRTSGSTFNGYQSSLYEDVLFSASGRTSSSHPVEVSGFRSSRASSRASSARTSPVDNCSSLASYLRSSASSSSVPRDLEDFTIPDFCEVEDRDYQEKGSRAASALTASTLMSLGGSSSRRGSSETALTVDAESSLREIKDALAEAEEKYRKAMVSNAQLDNEKNNLMYQVDTLKDSLMELEELLSESRREYQEKVKEYERQKQAHGVLQFQFSEVKETLKQSEELLNKHGIILRPDLNINGDVSEVEVNGTPAAEPASQDAARTQTEGSSMLEEAELRGCRDEALDPEQLEEDKDSLSSPETPVSVADESKLETSCRKQLSEGQETRLTSREDTRDLAFDINVCLLTDGVSWNHQEVLVCYQSAPDLTEPQCGTVGTARDLITHEMDGKLVESSFRDTKSQPEGSDARIPKSEISVSSSDTQQEPENRDEAEGMPSKPQSHTASGKKKKKKRKGKKNEGVPENKSQQMEKENVGSAVSKGLTEEPGLSGSIAESLKASPSDQIKNRQENREPTESVPHKEPPQEPGVDPVSDQLGGDEMSVLEEDEAGTLREENVEEDEDKILKPEDPGSAESAESFTGPAPEELGMDPVSDELCETKTTSDAVGSTQTLKEARVECAEKALKKEETSENVESAEPTGNSSRPEPDQEPITGPVSALEEVGDDVLSEEETMQSGEAEKPNQGSSDVGSVKEHVTVEGMGPEPELDLLRSETKLGDDVSGGGLLLTESETVDGPESSCESGGTRSENTGAPGSGPANISEKKEESTSPPHEQLTETSSGSAPVPVGSSDSGYPLTDGPEEEAGDMSPCQDADESKQNQDRTKNMDVSGGDGGREVHSELNRSPDEERGGCVSLPTQTQTGDTKNGPDGTERTGETETFGPEEVESSSEEPTEDPEHNNAQQNQEMDSSLCSLAEPEHGSDSQTCKSTDSPQPLQLDGDEDEEGEEGQSFDFDDLDIEAAEESSKFYDPKEQEVEQATEATSFDLSETHRNAEATPSDSRGQGEAPDGGNQGENRNSLTQEGAAAAEMGGACEEEEAADPAEEEQNSYVVQENLNQKISLSVEEGLDAIQLNSDSPKSTEEAGDNNDTPQSGKDSKKSSKKGKGKGKEECKMS